MTTISRLMHAAAIHLAPVPVLLAAAAGVFGAPGAGAQERFPSRPLRLIVPFAAGGPGDVIARALNAELGNALGQPVVVDNRPGADGALGTDIAARAVPDGHTILQVANTNIINMVLKEKPGYDLQRDFVPVARAAQVSMVLVTPISSPARTVAELVALAKSRREGLIYGTGGNGTVGHLSTELFKRATGTVALHVPYKGTGAAMPDLIAGRVDFFFGTPAEAVPRVKGGQLRAIATTSATRLAVLPDVPTMIELGFAGFDPGVIYGYMAPVNTPAAAVETLQAAVAKALLAPAVQQAMQSVAVFPHYGNAQEFASTIKSEIARWNQVIKAASIRAD